MPPRRSAKLLLAAACLWICTGARGATPGEDAGDQAALPPAAAPAAPSAAAQSTAPPSFPAQVLGDVGAYFTAPLRWDRSDWGWFGGTVVAIGLAHRYDAQVRTHFVGTGPATSTNTHDTQDAIPTAVVFGGTWAFALLTQDRDGYGEGWAMLEAGALSGVTGYALKFAAARQRPDATTNPNEWFKGGDSFPSLHSTAAFAVGTVLAESGNDDYRYLRRLLGYGLGVFTSYERLKHDAHWLSDTVAGAALGISSARFTMDRRYGSGGESHFALVPLEGGAMLTYRVSLD
ncbi:MAG TPA: phosphatase PAP2 family protein [Steroidobacteraceae bacterium]|nr:phosphatase PAP2 family protein [Steroidobacteraceae bacterium]